MPNDPSELSSDFAAMSEYFAKADAILEGPDAIRAATTTYLPRFPEEGNDEYEYRLANSKFTNIFRDIVENLASKPFARRLDVGAKASARMKEFADDVDGRGNHLHVFAADSFFSGIGFGMDWLLVDHTKVPPGLTAELERKVGARPYWVHIPATRMIAVYSDLIAGKEEIVHARFSEPTIIRDGFSEVEKNRVRVLDRPKLSEMGEDGATYGPATFQVWEEQKDPTDPRKTVWAIVDQGPISIGVIALVPFLTGRRKLGTWQVFPPLKDAAHLQIKHYQQETNLESAKERSCFPILVGNGIAPPKDQKGNPVDVPYGPASVLYAPMHEKTGTHGNWDVIEPSAESLKFVAEGIETTEKQLRELGRQPLTAQSGNLTVVTTMVAAAKGNSAVQAWALNLKDALERAFDFTAMWLAIEEDVEVDVHIDFGVDMQDAQIQGTLTDMRKNGDLSQRTLWKEMKRRNVLSTDFDPEAEADELAKEAPEEPDDDELLAALPGGRKPPTVPPAKKAA